MDNSKKKNILLAILIVGVVSMTVAFAALTTRLSLNGTANVAATSWNIHFREWSKVSIPTVTYEGNTHNNTAQSPEVDNLTMADETNVTKVSGINVTLNQPGDTAKYLFEIINEGTIDAKLDNFTATNTSNNQLVDYDVKCYASNTREGTEVTENSVLLKNGGKAYCYLQVTYKDQSNSHTAGTNQVYNQGAVSTELSAQWTWIQDDSNSGSQVQTGGQSGGSSWSELVGNSIAGFDIFSTPTQYMESTLPDNQSIWVQENSSTGVKELCKVFPRGTVCMSTPYNMSYEDYSFWDDYEDCPFNEDEYSTFTSDNLCLKGYTKTKAIEMLSKGASKCEVNYYLHSENSGNGSIRCYIDNYICLMDVMGNIICDSDNDYCKIDYDDSESCDTK